MLRECAAPEVWFLAQVGASTLGILIGIGLLFLIWKGREWINSD